MVRNEMETKIGPPQSVRLSEWLGIAFLNVEACMLGTILACGGILLHWCWVVWWLTGDRLELRNCSDTRLYFEFGLISLTQGAGVGLLLHG